MTPKQLLRHPDQVEWHWRGHGHIFSTALFENGVFFLAFRFSSLQPSNSRVFRSRLYFPRQSIPQSRCIVCEQLFTVFGFENWRFWRKSSPRIICRELVVWITFLSQICTLWLYMHCGCDHFFTRQNWTISQCQLWSILLVLNLTKRWLDKSHSHGRCLQQRSWQHLCLVQLQDGRHDSRRSARDLYGKK